MTVKEDSRQNSSHAPALQADVRTTQTVSPAKSQLGLANGPQDRDPSQTNTAILQGQDSVNVFIGIRQQSPLTSADQRGDRRRAHGRPPGNTGQELTPPSPRAERTAVFPGDPRPEHQNSPGECSPFPSTVPIGKAFITDFKRGRWHLVGSDKRLSDVKYPGLENFPWLKSYRY